MHLGGFGLLIMGVLDSSFLVLPLGNDLLVIALTARQHMRLFYYAAMATVGSVMGCFILDLVSRRGGERGLECTLGHKRTEYVRRRVKKSAGWALVIALVWIPLFSRP